MQYNSKIIIACDFNNKQELYDFLQKMGNEKLFLKLGMQLLYFEGFEIINELKKQGHNIFVDLKIYDILNTSVNAIKSLAKYKPDFVSIHSLTNLKTLKAMQQIAKINNINLVAVTILTSLDNEDLKLLNISLPLEEMINSLILKIKAANIFGVVSSASESAMVKKNNLISITPGIRLKNNDKHDQKRICTPKNAILNGADFLVIGRSITSDLNPLKVYNHICMEIKEA